MKKMAILLALMVFSSNFTFAKMQEMSDEELSKVAFSAPLVSINQIILMQLQNQIDQNSSAVEILKLMNPIVNFLDSDIVLKDVVYDDNQLVSTMNPDGSITLRLPTSIGEVQFNNIRPTGQDSAPSFGSISIKNIQLIDTKVTIKVNGSLNLPVTVK